MLRNSVYQDLPFIQSNVASLEINTSLVRDSQLQVRHASIYDFPSLTQIRMKGPKEQPVSMRAKTVTFCSLLPLIRQSGAGQTILSPPVKS